MAQVLALWRNELREIEARRYSEPLDYTRAAIVRACIRSAEIDILREEENR